MGAPLEREIAAYDRMQAELAPHEGKYALISEDELLGIFDSYSDALNAGYKERGLEPFLVKRISTVEVLANFSRDLHNSCIAPAL